MTWNGSQMKSPRQRQIEARLDGMDAGEYVTECRAQGMTWVAIARLLTEDTGVWINPKQCSSLLSSWQMRWKRS